jgi:hypothetical protein
MTDVVAGAVIKKDYMDYYCINDEDVKYFFTLTSDTPRFEIESLLRNNYDNIYNDEDGVAFPIYEYNKSTIERFRQYDYGEKFHHFINSLLDINSEKYYVCIIS